MTNAQLPTNSKSSEVYQQLILDTLPLLPEDQREALRVAAIPRYFYSENLAAVLSLPANKASALYKQLQSIPFVQPYGDDSHLVFEVVRNFILQDWVSTGSEEYLEHNKKLVHYYQQRADRSSAYFCAERVEAIYHQLAINKELGFARFEREFLRALEMAQFEHCDFLLTIANERYNELNVINQLWLDFYAGILAEKLEDWKTAQDKYKTIQLKDGWPVELRGLLLKKLMGVSRMGQGVADGQAKDGLGPEEKTPIRFSGIDIESEISLLEDFYRQNQSEAKLSFILALAAGSIGFLIIISGILGAYFWNTQFSVVTSSAGVVVEIVAALLIVQNSRASKKMKEAQTDLIRMRNLSRALQVVETAIISPAERENQVTKILDELIGIKQS